MLPTSTGLASRQPAIPDNVACSMFPQLLNPKGNVWRRHKLMSGTFFFALHMLGVQAARCRDKTAKHSIVSPSTTLDLQVNIGSPRPSRGICISRITLPSALASALAVNRLTTC